MNETETSERVGMVCFMIFWHDVALLQRERECLGASCCAKMGNSSSSEFKAVRKNEQVDVEVSQNVQ